MYHYEEPPSATARDLEAALQEGDTQKICERVIWIALEGEDPGWLTNVAVGLGSHPSLDVRRASITALGHIARVQRSIERSVVVPHLLLMAENPQLAGRAQDALDDIETFAAGQ